MLGAGQHWFNLDAVFAERGMQAVGEMGRANMRADVGGLFLGIGCFTLFAAARQNRSALVAAAVMLCSTLIGRFISIAIEGYSVAARTPIVIEAIALSALCAAYYAWGKKPEGL